MAQRFRRDPANYSVGAPIIVANSKALSVADAVSINSSGFLDVAGTSAKILGYSLDDIAAVASNNQTVAQVTARYVYADAVEVVYPISGGVAATVANLGQYCNLVTTTTGAQNVTAAASMGANTGQFLVMEFTPENDGVAEVTVKAAWRQDVSILGTVS